MRRRSVSIDVSALSNLRDQVASQEEKDKKKKKKEKREIKAASKSSKDTKLLEAAFKGNVKDVQMLLKKGAFIHAKDEATGETALHLACQSGQDAVVDVLLQEGADPNLLSYNGQTPVHQAAGNGQAHVLRILLKKCPNADVNVFDKHAFTPLQIAITTDQFESFKLLLENGADANKVDDRGESPLHSCCSCDFWKGIPLLVEKGCDVNRRSVTGNTPLHVAAQEGFVSCIVALLAAGAAIDIRNNQGRTAKDVAKIANKLDVAEMLESTQKARGPVMPKLPVLPALTPANHPYQMSPGSQSARSMTELPRFPLPRAGSNTAVDLNLALPPPPLPPRDDEVLEMDTLSLPPPPSPSIENLKAFSLDLPKNLPPPPSLSSGSADSVALPSAVNARPTIQQFHALHSKSVPIMPSTGAKPPPIDPNKADLAQKLANQSAAEKRNSCDNQRQYRTKKKLVSVKLNQEDIEGDKRRESAPPATLLVENGSGSDESITRTGSGESLSKKPPANDPVRTKSGPQGRPPRADIPNATPNANKPALSNSDSVPAVTTKENISTNNRPINIAALPPPVNAHGLLPPMGKHMDPRRRSLPPNMIRPMDPNNPGMGVWDMKGPPGMRNLPPPISKPAGPSNSASVPAPLPRNLKNSSGTLPPPITAAGPTGSDGKGGQRIASLPPPVGGAAPPAPGVRIASLPPPPSAANLPPPPSGVARPPVPPRRLSNADST